MFSVLIRRLFGVSFLVLFSWYVLYSNEDLENNYTSFLESVCDNSMFSKLCDAAPFVEQDPGKVTIVVTTQRSGSSFFGDMLHSVRKSFYFFEPFERYRTGRNTLAAERFIREILECNFTRLNRKIWSYNAVIQQKCLDDHEQCNKTSAEALCQTQRRFVVKTVKQPARVMQHLFAASDADRFNGLLLVRDPRAVYNSRRKLDWCLLDPDCISTKALCNRMTANYFEAQELMEKYPEKFTVVRYEDFIHNLDIAPKKLFKFLNLPFGSSTRDFLESHTTQQIETELQEYSTYRNSSETPLRWVKELSFEETVEVQRDCEEAMKLFGYKLVKSADEMTERFRPTFKSFFNFKVQ